MISLIGRTLVTQCPPAEQRESTPCPFRQDKHLSICIQYLPAVRLSDQRARPVRMATDREQRAAAFEGGAHSRAPSETRLRVIRPIVEQEQIYRIIQQLLNGCHVIRLRAPVLVGRDDASAAYLSPLRRALRPDGAVCRAPCDSHRHL